MLRAFDLKTGKVLWTFQTGRQIAAGPTIFTADGKEYIAITVGGTPTSSGGGLASQLQVFALGGQQGSSRRSRSIDQAAADQRRRQTRAAAAARTAAWPTRQPPLRGRRGS